MHPSIPIALVFIGCCSNVVFLEYLVKAYPGSGNIITFSQFLFIALEGFIFTMNFGRRKPVIPLSTYFIMVTIFFMVQVVNNLAFAFNVAMTLHMIFRAGSLIANLVLGVMILKREYKMSKYVSVLMITVGICICTIVSAKNVSAKEGETEEEGAYQFLRWIIGISMLTFALFMSARMGIYQEQVYTKYGKHPSEALFFNHALPLPIFVFFAMDIFEHAKLINTSEPLSLPGLPGGLPYMWLMLLGNVVTQYICIRGVFILTTECTSLTVTLVVTLRKFTSLIFSIWYFQNPFTLYHWVGTTLVFGGTLIFTETIPKILEAVSSSPKQKSQ